MANAFDAPARRMRREEEGSCGAALGHGQGEQCRAMSDAAWPELPRLCLCCRLCRVGWGWSRGEGGAAAEVWGHSSGANGSCHEVWASMQLRRLLPVITLMSPTLFQTSPSPCAAVDAGYRRSGAGWAPCWQPLAPSCLPNILPGSAGQAQGFQTELRDGDPVACARAQRCVKGFFAC